MIFLASHPGTFHSCEPLWAAPIYRASGKVSTALNVARNVFILCLRFYHVSNAA